MTFRFRRNVRQTSRSVAVPFALPLPDGPGGPSYGHNDQEFAFIEDFFSERYDEARLKFRRAAQLAKAETHEIAVSVVGPQGLPLTIDIAVLGPRRPNRAVVHVSGVHGLEAFSGSAVQLAALASRPILPSDVALVFVHTFNPWAAAWLRRANENNVDLNRNFLLGDPVPPTPPLYRTLHPLLNRESPPSRDYFLLQLISTLYRHGFGALQQVVAGGQYEFPNGLFYGGTELEEGPRKFLEWIVERLTGVHRMAVLDLHTGLGTYGRDFLFVEPGSSEETKRRVLDVFGKRVHAQESDGRVYRCTGTLLSAVERMFPEARVDALCQEFGTYPPPWILKALRQENRFHLFGSAEKDDPHAHPIKRATWRMFHPRSRWWRGRVLQQGDQRLQQAVASLDR